MQAFDPRTPYPNRPTILGAPVDLVTLAQAIEVVHKSVELRNRLFISTPNLNFLAQCHRDENFMAALKKSDLILVDGMPLVWIGRLFGIHVPERVAGSDLFEALRNAAEPSVQLKVFFFGGPQGIAKKAHDNINASNSKMRSVGYHYPGTGSIEDMSSPELIKKINDSNADFLVIALGAQKGQAWIIHNMMHLTIPVISHLGAVINFVAGEINRAPKWMQKIGLEWLWRIKEEPNLWRRYATDGWLVARLIFASFLDRKPSSLRSKKY